LKLKLQNNKKLFYTYSTYTTCSKGVKPAHHLLALTPLEENKLKELVDASSTTKEVKSKLCKEHNSIPWWVEASKIFFLTESDIRAFEISIGVFRGEPVNLEDMATVRALLLQEAKNGSIVVLKICGLEHDDMTTLPTFILQGLT
jgi:hypothetical protein